MRAVVLEQRRAVRALSWLPSPAEEEEDGGAASDAYSSSNEQLHLDPYYVYDHYSDK